MARIYGGDAYYAINNVDISSWLNSVSINFNIGAGAFTNYFVPGGGAGSVDNPIYRCTAGGLVGTFVTSYNISLPVGDASKFTASLQNSGSTTRETS